MAMAYRVELCFPPSNVLLAIYKTRPVILLAVPLAPKALSAILLVLLDAHIVQLARTAQPRPQHLPLRVLCALSAHSATAPERPTFQRALSVCLGQKVQRWAHQSATYARLDRMPSLRGSKRAINAQLDLSR